MAELSFADLLRRVQPAGADAPRAWTPAAVRQQVWDEAKRQDVDPNLAINLTWQESRFRPNLTSPKGAYGPMQLMPGTAKDLAVDPYDVAQNIRGGITYLKQQLARFGGDQRKALAAYNAGPGAVERYGDVPPYKETQGYVRTILGRAGQALSPRSVEAAELSYDQLMQRLGQPSPATQTPQAPPGAAPMPQPPAAPAAPTPSPWHALTGAFAGTQRLPFQAGAPPEGTAPEALATAAAKESTPGKVIDWLAGTQTDPANVGQLIGSTLTPLGFKPVGGAIGAGLGEGYRHWRAGEPLSPYKMMQEGITALVPEVLESAGRGTVRQFARQSPGGKILRGEQATEEARQVPGHVFHPRPAEQISDAFEQVRRSGLNIDTEDITQHIRTLSSGKQDDVRNVLTQLDRQHRTGGRYSQLYDDLMRGQGMAGRSIGDLQALRSHLRQRVATMEPGEARQLVRDLQGAVDDAIDFGMTSGAMSASSQQIRDTLHGARRDWAQRVAADDLGDMIEGKITSSPDMGSSMFNLRGLADDLRRGRSEASRSINRALDLTPGARQQFAHELQTLSRLYERVELPMTDVQGLSRWPGVAAVRQGIGQLLLTDTGRALFRNAVLEGRGRLSPNAVAMLLSAATRQGLIYPHLTGYPGDREPSESQAGPGGIARSTD